MAIATLKRRAEFLRVRGGRRWSSPAFVIEMRARSGSDRPMRADIGAEKAKQDGQVADQLSLTVSTSQPDGEPARFGFTATKKLGNAVMRNRIRRRLKEAVRLTAPIGAQAGCDYVLIAREAAATRPFATLERDLSEAFAALHAPSARGPHTPRKDTRGGDRTPSTRGRAKRPDPASESS